MAITADFNLGTLGNTIATADPGSANAWNAVFVGANATLTYDNARIHGGPLACKMNSGTVATNNTAWMMWEEAFGTQTEHFGRFYINPDLTWDHAAGDVIMQFGANGINGKLVLAASQTFTLRDAGNVIRATTPSLALDAWTRVEFHVIHSVTVGFMEVLFFTGANVDGTIPDSTTSTAANLDFSASTDRIQIGMTSNDVNVVYWLDDIVAAATSYPGSSVVTAPIFYIGA